MFILTNKRYAGKSLVIGSYGEVAFDDDGNARVPEEVAASCKNLPFFTATPVIEDTKATRTPKVTK